MPERTRAQQIETSLLFPDDDPPGEDPCVLTTTIEFRGHRAGTIALNLREIFTAATESGVEIHQAARQAARIAELFDPQDPRLASPEDWLDVLFNDGAYTNDSFEDVCELISEWLGPRALTYPEVQWRLTHEATSPKRVAAIARAFEVSLRKRPLYFTEKRGPKGPRERLNPQRLQDAWLLVYKIHPCARAARKIHGTKRPAALRKIVAEFLPNLPAKEAEILISNLLDARPMDAAKKIAAIRQRIPVRRLHRM